MLLSKDSTELNHFSHRFLLALKTSPALLVLNLTAMFIPPMYLTSEISKPSSDTKAGKLHNVSKLLATPTNNSELTQSWISGMIERDITGA
ncbi:hypothetical protein LXL04_031489 [Taraxacum kok-saghyz]